ncbi:MAG: serine/threonine protein kinase [Actinobacteria bacterium]|nr:serine/threonine protein kinase [Actinomycetota bacterium]
MTDRASWHLQPGDAVAGGRRVVRQLGGGKRTEVVLARGEDPSDLVVVKLLRPSATGVAARALLAEGELLGRLDHPLFPRLLELREDRGALQLVLEHVPGPRLSTAVRRTGPLGAADAARLVLELADGLASLHRAGAVHLDVKPSNTILSSRSRLLDLGVARSLADAAAVRGLVGSHRFQSPEQHDPASFGGLSPATDVWGVGVTVATALRGSSPFGPLRDERDVRRRLAPDDVRRLELPAEVPAVLERLVRDAMAWEPAARPAMPELVDRARAVDDELSGE